MVRLRPDANGIRHAVALLFALALTAAPGEGQSLLDRSPNIQGPWVGHSGTVFFHTMHRFISTGPPARKLVQTPTFLMGGTVAGVLVGANYSTNSSVVAGIPNEWEFFGRYALLRETAGAPLDLAVQAGYNQAALSWDGQLVAARELGPVRLLVAGRGFSNAFDAGQARFAVALGGVARLTEFVAVGADYGTLLGRTSADGRSVWSAGVHLGIPYTPHTLSVHASNTGSKTLQGSSVGGQTVRYGFEFTVPVTLSRYFGTGAETRTPAPESPRPQTDTREAVEVGMTNRLEFSPDTVRIAVGETVRWTNTSALLHTVTADPEKAADPASVSLPAGADAFDSGNMEPEDTFEYTFTVPGTYKYFCIPHEAASMVGWIIVTESGDDHE